MTIVAEQTFVPPGPGSWFLDPTHWTRPVTRFHAEIFPERSSAASSESLRRYGSLLEYLEAGFRQRLPLLLRPSRRRAAGGGRPSPEGGVGRARAHSPRDPAPPLDERNGVRAQALARGPRALGPRGEARGDPDPPGAAQDRSRHSSTRLRLLAVPRSVPREPDSARRYIHHLFNVPALLPVGDFLVCAQEWTGRSPAQLLGLLQGANPDPLGADQELERLVGALRHEAAATEACSPPRESRARWLPRFARSRARSGAARFRLRRPGRLPAG